MGRLPTDQEKQIVFQKHKGKCYVTGEKLKDIKHCEFHHIRPFIFSEDTSMDNMAPVTKRIHRKMGLLCITEFKDKLELDKFFGNEEKRLDDILKGKIKNFGEKITFSIDEDEKKIEIITKDGEKIRFPFYTCNITKEKFFYGLLPAKVLKNDKKLQPRPIEKKRLWDMYLHLSRNTLLSPAIGRLTDENEILIFDGQHKSGAKLWLGEKELECKVYIKPDIQKLQDTNLVAHEKLRQMQFKPSILASKYSSIRKRDMDEFTKICKEPTEKKLMNFLIEDKRKSKAEALKEITLSYHNFIIKNEDNKLGPFISDKSSKDYPLTYNLVNKTFFMYFFTKAPLEFVINTGEDLRDEEKENIINLMNIITKHVLNGKWNPDANNSGHKRARRIFLAGTIKAWMYLLREAIAHKLNIIEEVEKKKIFFRKISKKNLEEIEILVKKLFSHKIWDMPDTQVGELKIDEPERVRNFMKTMGLTAAWILGINE